MSRLALTKPSWLGASLRRLAGHGAAPNLVYGSDWIMVGQEEGAEEYAVRIAAAAAEAGLPADNSPGGRPSLGSWVSIVPARCARAPSCVRPTKRTGRRRDDGVHGPGLAVRLLPRATTASTCPATASPVTRARCAWLRSHSNTMASAKGRT